ncbi:hypothetical protein JCGZ_18616 [Jatropha curcas]|uniref:Aminotransferase-like plant mobile domain-containing protein n=1 Tax=Jatropha curcas TaxID=180498 RepID=A0A067KCS4_JATCU|nr:hypothetical protein JCGZ_18616 [Jatropha curcas]
MDTAYTFNLPFGEMMITAVDFAAITGLPFEGWYVIFDDQMRTLNHSGLRVSLRAAIRVKPTISDNKDLCIRGVRLNVGYWRIIKIDSVGVGYHSCYERFSCHISFSSLYVWCLCHLRADQLLVHIPFPSEFYPFVEVEELNRGQGIALVQRRKRVRRGSNSRAPNMVAVVSKPKQV